MSYSDVNPIEFCGAYSQVCGAGTKALDDSLPRKSKFQFQIQFQNKLCELLYIFI